MHRRLLAAILGLALVACLAAKCAPLTGYHGSHSCRHLERLWDRAGGSSANAELMASIAMAESGGRQYATGTSGERGFWQIMPTWGSRWSTYDQLGNARGAVHVYRVQGPNAWTTYRTGAYAGRC